MFMTHRAVYQSQVMWPTLLRVVWIQNIPFYLSYLPTISKQCWVPLTGKVISSPPHPVLLWCWTVAAPLSFYRRHHTFPGCLPRRTISQHTSTPSQVCSHTLTHLHCLFKFWTFIFWFLQLARCWILVYLCLIHCLTIITIILEPVEVDLLTVCATHLMSKVLTQTTWPGSVLLNSLGGPCLPVLEDQPTKLPSCTPVSVYVAS